MIKKDITIDIEGNETKLTLYILDSSPELYYEKDQLLLFVPAEVIQWCLTERQSQLQ